MKKFMFISILAAILAVGLVKNNSAFATDSDVSSSQGLGLNDAKDEAKEDDRLATNAKTGKKSSDFINQCYLPTYDGDYDGKLQLCLISENKPDSVFYDKDKIRIEFFDASGNRVLVKDTHTKYDFKESCSFGLDGIDKFELKFGQTYKLKFYEATQAATDENLLATYDLNVLKSEKSDSINDYKFEIASEGAYPRLNVSAGEADNEVSDRLKFTFEKVKKQGKQNSNNDNIDDNYVRLKLECLSNDNNADSIFKNVESLIVDFIGANGEVLLTGKTSSSKVDSKVNVVKSKLVEVSSPGASDQSFSFHDSCEFINGIKQLNFYDGSDEGKTKILANYKFNKNVVKLGDDAPKFLPFMDERFFTSSNDANKLERD